MHGSLYLEYLGLPHPPVGCHFVKDALSSDSHRSRQDSPPYITSTIVLTTSHCDRVFVSLSHVLDNELLKMRPDLTPLWFPSCQPVPQYQFAKEENKAMLSSLNVSFLSRFCLFFTMEVREVDLSHLWSLPQPVPHQPVSDPRASGLCCLGHSCSVSILFSHPYIQVLVAHFWLSGASHSASAWTESRVCRGTPFPSRPCVPMYFQSLDINLGEETLDYLHTHKLVPISTHASVPPTLCEDKEKEGRVMRPERVCEGTDPAVCRCSRGCYVRQARGLG